MQEFNLQQMLYIGGVERWRGGEGGMNSKQHMQ